MPVPQSNQQMTDTLGSKTTKGLVSQINREFWEMSKKWKPN